MSRTQEPADRQEDHYLTAADGRVEQPPLIAAVHPAGHRTTSGHAADTDRVLARVRIGPRPGDLFYLNVRQVRQQHANKIKIARRT